MHPSLGRVGGVEERSIQRKHVYHCIRRRDWTRAEVLPVVRSHLRRADVFDARGQRKERRVVRADDRAGDDGIAAQRGRHHRACDHGVAARGSHRALDHRALDRHLRSHAGHD